MSEEKKIGENGKNEYLLNRKNGQASEKIWIPQKFKSLFLVESQRQYLYNNNGSKNWSANQQQQYS